MVTRLGSNVWWVNLTGTNAYLVDDDGTLTLVDAGMPWQSRHLASAITTVGESIGDVERVLVTHYDIDHVGGLGALDALDATVYIGRGDYPYLVGERTPSWKTGKGMTQRAVGWLLERPSLPVEPVDDGGRLGSFTAYSAPGHTPGHTVYVSEAHSVAFLGDLVWESGGELDVVPRFICHDYQQTRRSVVDVADRVPPFEVACPGHGVPFVERGYERLRACADAIAVAP